MCLHIHTELQQTLKSAEYSSMIFGVNTSGGGWRVRGDASMRNQYAEDHRHVTIEVYDTVRCFQADDVMESTCVHRANKVGVDLCTVRTPKFCAGQFGQWKGLSRSLALNLYLV